MDKMESAYLCSSCGQMHAGSPSFSFIAPYYYSILNNKGEGQSKLNEDLCSILEQDFFVRAVLEIPIIGQEVPFTWGVWVSQSHENFSFYVEHFVEDLNGRDTFGFFSNQLPYYTDTLGLKCRVLFQGKGNRPKLHLEETEHELSLDFHHGITAEKAAIISEAAQHNESQ